MRDEAGEPQSAPPPSAAVASGSRWGGLEIASLLLIGLAWPALFLPYGFFLWLGMGVVGVVLAWASGWTTRQKLITTVVVAALYAAVFIVVTPVRVESHPTGSPIVTTAQ